MGLNVPTLGHMQIYHSCGDICMPQKIFKGYDIQSFFKQMGGIGMSQGVQVDIFGNGCFFQVFAHYPCKPANAVLACGVFPVEEPYIWIFCLQVLYQPHCHYWGEGHDSVFLILCLANVNGHPLKINI